MIMRDKQFKSIFQIYISLNFLNNNYLNIMNYGAQGHYQASPSMANSMASINFQMGSQNQGLQGHGTDYQSNRQHNASTNSYGGVSGRNTQSHISNSGQQYQPSQLSIGPPKSNGSAIQTNQSKQKNEVIKVCIRVRPLLRNELHLDEIVYYPDSDDPSLQGIRIADGQHLIESRFDRVFNQYTAQTEVFDFVRGNIDDVLNGFNSTIFAYGQTGSGKTFTMFGPHWDDSNQMTPQGRSGGGLGSSFKSQSSEIFLQDQQQYGIIPRAIEHLFKGLSVMMMDGIQGFTVYCSFLQIYNERLFDLFQDKESGKPLNIREDKYTGIFVEGQSEYVVTTANDCFTLLKRGEANRITRQTRSNIHSSRSHTIFQILVESDTADSNGLLFRGKLNLCDLAGSEKIHKSESMNAQHFNELKTINQSLSSLGKVITALAQGKKKDHIPYRDSKITRLLQDSLGGNTKTTLIAACNSKADCVSETISTLKFADRAKQIMVKVSANTVSAADDALVIKLQKEVQHLKDILNLNRKGGVLDVHQQLLVLKEENSRLKDQAGKVSQVEKLKYENKLMRIELQEMKAQGMSEGFKAIGFQSGAGYGHADQNALTDMSVDYGNKGQRSPRPQLAIQQQESSPNKGGGGGGFFLTETEQFNNEQQSPIGMRSNLPQSINKQNSLSIGHNQAHYNQVQQQQELALIQNRDLNSTIESKRSHQAGGPLPMIPNQSMPPQQTFEQQEQQRLIEIKAKAVTMKGSLAYKGRCPICTLKPPCKHYDSIEALNLALGQSTTQSSQQSFAKNDAIQATPERGVFYPQKDLSQVSITTGSIHDKHQRSDGFSINSAQQVGGPYAGNRGAQGTPGSVSKASDKTLQNNGEAILKNITSQQNKLPPSLNDVRVTSPDRKTPNGKPPINPYYQNQNPVPAMKVMDQIIAPKEQESKTSNFEKKTSALSQIFAEQDALQKKLLSGLNRPSSPPKEQVELKMTKEQQRNIMRSGPDSGFQPEPRKTEEPKEKDYDEELRQQKIAIQEQIDALKNQLTVNEQNTSNLINHDQSQQQIHQSSQQTYNQEDRQHDLQSPQSIRSYPTDHSNTTYSTANQMPYQPHRIGLPPAHRGGRRESRGQNLSQFQQPNNMYNMQNNLRTPQHQGPQGTDKIQVRIRSKNNFVENRVGSVTRTLGELDQKKKQKRDLSQATQRLRVLEDLEKYREEKVAQEMMMLEMQRQQQEDQIRAQIAADKKKQAYLAKQKAKLQEYQEKKAADLQAVQLKAEQEKQMKESQRKKFLKDQEKKKKQIADYKQKKLEAEEILANADLPEFDEYDDDFEDSHAQNMVKSYTKDNTTMKGGFQPKQKAAVEMDDEDRYLDEILNKNYTGKAPPAVN